MTKDEPFSPFPSKMVPRWHAIACAHGMSGLR